MTPLSGMSAAFLKGPTVNGSYEEQAEWDPGATAIPLKLDRPPGLVDHARLALFLASEESAYISGQAISLDGAQMARVGTQPAPIARRRGAPAI
jgi:NAD(P)-dependent dehydrogenase (short-subunit alcohol dehydrogenase family)